MGHTRGGGIAWFKVFTHIYDIVANCPDAELGQGFRAAMRLSVDPLYTGEELSPMAFMIFSGLRKGVDESHEDYDIAVLNGRRGALKRWAHLGTETAEMLAGPPPVLLSEDL